MKQSNSRWAVNFTALVLAAGLLIGLLTGCPGTAGGGTPSVPVDPAAILNTDGHGKITGYKCAKEELPSHLVIPAKIGDEEIKEISSWAFSDCTGLTSVYLPVSITEIKSTAFGGCTGITSLTIDSANTKYKTEDNILYSKDGTTLIFAAGGLTSANIPGTVTTIDGGAFSGCTGLTSITLPTNLTQIDEYAFYDCKGLTSITLPANLTQIGQYAFYGCTGLTSITLPANLTQIDGSTFSGCTGLTSLTIDSANATYKTEDNILYNKAGTILILAAGGLTSVNIPDTVTTIGQYAFYDCTGLTSITLPTNLTQIGQHAFSGCTGLTSITLPANLTQIGQYAFYGCTGLTSVTLPANLTQIGLHAFYDCTGLTSVFFEDKEGWKVYDNDSYSGTPTSISSIDLADASKAAEYLRETTDKGGYSNKYWKKD